MLAKPPPINKNLSSARTDTPHNVRRRERYARDFEYRKKIMDNTRRSRKKLVGRIRKSGPFIDKMLRLSGPDGLDELRRFALTRFAYPDKNPVLCYTQLALAAAVGKSPDTITFMARNGFIPKPELRVYSPTGRVYNHYSMDQVVRFARALVHVATGKGSVHTRHGPQLLKLQLQR